MKVLISGGGIGGLTAAIALQKEGIDIQVFEQALEIKEVGAGLWLAPNGMQIMNRLNLVEEMQKIGNTIIRIQVADSKGKSIIASDNEKDGIIKKFGFSHLAIHRASLQQLLFKQIQKDKVLTGKHFIRYEESKDKVIAYFADGSKYEGDCLVGADGLKSLVRKQLFGGVLYRYSGQTCWRGIAEMKLPAKELHDVKEVWLQGAGLRAAYAQINSHQVYFYITRCAPPNGQDEKGAIKKHLHSLTKGAPGLINDVISSTDGSHIIRDDLNDFAPIRQWTRGNVVLTGDAAHATTPNLGQGANQAIESAYCLANCLSENNNIGQAFLQYQKTRMVKAHFVTNRSWRLGQISGYSSSFARAVRNQILRHAPHSLTVREFNRLYSLNF